jgi:hypothetical protein
MLTLMPKSWFSWNFRLEEPVGNAVAEVRLSSWRDRGSVVVGGVTYTIRRDGLLGPFVMEAPDGSMVGTAVKPSMFRAQFFVGEREPTYLLKREGFFRRRYGLFRDDRRIGSIVPGLWLRRADVELAEEVPETIRAFLIWLACLLWKRAVAAAAS